MPATTVCPKCKAGLVNIVSGAVCPNGCPGGPYKLLKPEVSRANVRAYKIAQLPEATRLPNLRAKKGDFADCHLYATNDRSLIFRRVVRDTMSLDKCPENHVLVRLGDKPIELALAPSPVDGRSLCLERLEPPDAHAILRGRVHD